jgi:hypothetical protein
MLSVLLLFTLPNPFTGEGFIKDSNWRSNRVDQRSAWQMNIEHDPFISNLRKRSRSCRDSFLSDFTALFNEKMLRCWNLVKNPDPGILWKREVYFGCSCQEKRIFFVGSEEMPHKTSLKTIFFFVKDSLCLLWLNEYLHVFVSQDSRYRRLLRRSLSLNEKQQFDGKIISFKTHSVSAREPEAMEKINWFFCFL